MDLLFKRTLLVTSGLLVLFTLSTAQAGPSRFPKVGTTVLYECTNETGGKKTKLFRSEFFANSDSKQMTVQRQSWESGKEAAAKFSTNDFSHWGYLVSIPAFTRSKDRTMIQSGNPGKLDNIQKLKPGVYAGKVKMVGNKGISNVAYNISTKIGKPYRKALPHLGRHNVVDIDTTIKFDGLKRYNVIKSIFVPALRILTDEKVTIMKGKATHWTESCSLAKISPPTVSPKAASLPLVSKVFPTAGTMKCDGGKSLKVLKSKNTWVTYTAGKKEIRTEGDFLGQQLGFYRSLITPEGVQLDFTWDKSVKNVFKSTLKPGVYLINGKIAIKARKVNDEAGLRVEVRAPDTKVASKEKLLDVDVSILFPGGTYRRTWRLGATPKQTVLLKDTFTGTEVQNCAL